MAKIDKYDIESIAESAFELALEDIEVYSGNCFSYDDMISKQQKEFIENLKVAFNRLCDDELDKINQNWSDDSGEVKRLKNRIKELENELEASRGNWGCDTGYE